MDEQSSVSSEEQISQLKFDLQHQTNVIENQKQELHTALKKLECMNVMKVEMEIEIEALNGLYQINGNLESKVKSLENDLLKLQSESQNLENQLANEKDNNEIICHELKNQVSNLEKELSMKQEKVLSQTTEELDSKCIRLQEQNKILNQNNDDLRIHKKEFECKICLLETTLNEKVQEIQELKDILKVKGDDLKSTTKLMKELQEEKLTLSAELMMLKTNENNHNNKGNSLFAEIEDKRVSTVSKLETMQKKYKELKMALIKKNSEIKSIESENNSLRKQWKEDSNAPYESVATLLESYKTRISELTSIVVELEKRPESPQIISISDLNNTQVNCIKSLLEYERKANRELRTEMEQRAVRELFEAEQLYDFRQKVKKMKSQMMKDATVISDLRSQLEYHKTSITDMSSENDTLLKDISNKKSAQVEPKNYSVQFENTSAKSVRFDETIMETSIVSNPKSENCFKKPSVYSKMHNVVSVKIGKENDG